MAAFIAEHHLTGWYFRVLLPGLVVPGDALDLVEPGDEGLNLAQAQQLWRQHRPAPLALRQLAATPASPRAGDARSSNVPTGWKSTPRGRPRRLRST